MHKKVGIFLMATAVIHTAIGFALFAQPWLDIWNAGILNSIDPHYDRATAFWFAFFGVLLWMLGQLVQWVQNRFGELPHSLGWWLMGLGVAGAAFMPVSGFWLVLPQAALILRSKVK